MKRKGLFTFVAWILLGVLMLGDAVMAGGAPTKVTESRVEVTADKKNVTITMDSYLIHGAGKGDLKIKAADIIVVLDQSAVMDKRRDTIIQSMNDLIDRLPRPTDGGEHKIAVLGYGRINNPGKRDSKDGLVGTLPSMNSACTGYYTCDGTNVNFHSAPNNASWIEGDADTPPTPKHEVIADNYNAMFHTGENAKKIFKTDKMVMWFAGAARLDAGLALANQVSEMAKTANPDRLQITVVVSGTAPFQDSSGVYTARKGACKENAEIIKTRGVIMTLGDYNESKGPDKTIDNQGIFDELMKGTIVSESKYYFSAEENANKDYAYGNISAALQELMTTIQNMLLGTSQDKDTIEAKAETFTSTTAQNMTYILQNYLLEETAQADYFPFEKYADPTTPNFKTDKYRENKGKVTQTDDSVSYTSMLVPIPKEEVYNYDVGHGIHYVYGEKIIVKVKGKLRYRVTLNSTTGTSDNQGINVPEITPGVSPLGSRKADPAQNYLIKLEAVAGKKLPPTIQVFAGDTELVQGIDYTYDLATGNIVVLANQFSGPINVVAKAIEADRKIRAIAYTGAITDPLIPSTKTYTKDTVGGVVQIAPGLGAGEVSKNDVQEGDSVTLDAVPNPGYVFIGWYDNDLFNTACISQLPQYTIPFANLTAGADNPRYALFVSTADKNHFVPIPGGSSSGGTPSTPGGAPALAPGIDETEKEKELAKITTGLPPVVVDVEEGTLSELAKTVTELPDPNSVEAPQWVAVETNGVKTYYTKVGDPLVPGQYLWQEVMGSTREQKPASPKTGDSSEGEQWLFIMLWCAIGMAACYSLTFADE